ncbi:MAG: Na(+)/H(+) antiporter subunit C [Pseudonocardia sp.]|nr:Na(+)/H(+) antiporter subunit C [Pseudonocardia sp.]
MTINLVMALTVGTLFAAGFYLLLQRSLMRVLLGVVVLGHGTNLLLQLAGGPPAAPAILGTSTAGAITDPLPQALALTAVVITFALTTFLLALGYRSFVLVGHDEVQDDVEDRRIATQTMPSASMDEDHDHSETRESADDEDADDDGPVSGSAARARKSRSWPPFPRTSTGGAG